MIGDKKIECPQCNLSDHTFVVEMTANHHPKPWFELEVACTNPKCVTVGPSEPVHSVTGEKVFIAGRSEAYRFEIKLSKARMEEMGVPVQPTHSPFRKDQVLTEETEEQKFQKRLRDKVVKTWPPTS